MKFDAQLIVKYLSQQYSDAELTCILEWIKSDKANETWLFDLKALWDKKQLAHLSEREYLENQFNATIAKIEEKSTQNKKTNRRNLLRVASTIAAACLLSFVVYLTISTSKKAHTPNYVTASVSSKDSIRKIILPDKSEVWLNTNSNIKYLPKFSKNERRVILDGEAYFNVAKNQNKPFRVETSAFTVRVLGTKFNVASYHTNEITETALYCGKIVIENRQTKEILLLNPGQKVQFSKKNKQFFVSNFNRQERNTWRNTYITFKNASLEEIIRKLRYIYNRQIEINANRKNDTMTYTGSVARENRVEDVLRNLQNTIDFRFEEKETFIIIE